jgi:hypothetical protein
VSALYDSCDKTNRTRRFERQHLERDVTSHADAVELEAILPARRTGEHQYKEGIGKSVFNATSGRIIPEIANGREHPRDRAKKRIHSPNTSQVTATKSKVKKAKFSRSAWRATVKGQNIVFQNHRKPNRGFLGAEIPEGSSVVDPLSSDGESDDDIPETCSYMAHIQIAPADKGLSYTTDMWAKPSKKVSEFRATFEACQSQVQYNNHLRCRIRDLKKEQNNVRDSCKAAIFRWAVYGAIETRHYTFEIRALKRQIRNIDKNIRVLEAEWTSRVGERWVEQEHGS